MADRERKRWKVTVMILVVLLVAVMAVPAFAAQGFNGFWGRSATPTGDTLATGPNGQNVGSGVVGVGRGFGMMGGFGFGGFGGMMGGFGGLRAGAAATSPMHDPDALATATGLTADVVKDLLTKAPPHFIVMADAIADLSGGKATAADVVAALNSGKTVAAVAQSYSVDLTTAQTAAQATWNAFLSELVKAGRLTQAQADLAASAGSNVPLIPGFGFGRGMMGGFGGPGGLVSGTPTNSPMYDPDALATATGLTADVVKDLLTKTPPHFIVIADAIADLSGGKATAADVVAALNSGKTLAAVAQSYGVDLTKAQTAAQATWNAFLSELVKAGKLTQAQANLSGTCPGINANVQGNAGNNVPVVPGRGFGRGMMGGRGGMMRGW